MMTDNELALLAGIADAAKGQAWCGDFIEFLRFIGKPDATISEAHQIVKIFSAHYRSGHMRWVLADRYGIALWKLRGSPQIRVIDLKAMKLHPPVAPDTCRLCGITEKEPRLNLAMDPNGGPDSHVHIHCKKTLYKLRAQEACCG
ncbi:hypothetical protein NVV94_05680 [Pseudomonas sp. LS1212]|uniref:hypothetical protein n=1 Tax=Pseudomonas sp. LS1212 TaxID=2972478 RepID=UPI00215BA487|nr:hypothetical protein [Pseudomonas sp. LS1212]UVJ45072.1 hypothetical protein NVV94_05680 [Pseudomonas sp. LS1212]